ncbi:MAG: penicillin-binding Tp47 domain C-containing protein [Eubacteriales bacterium]|nr:penicillin-binding Tp47 domain C-containing protein [Eubacteriales bacterium]
MNQSKRLLSLLLSASLAAGMLPAVALADEVDDTQIISIDEGQIAEDVAEASESQDAIVVEENAGSGTDNTDTENDSTGEEVDVSGQETENVQYVLMNIPYEKFYEAEVNNNDVAVDSVSSATKNKTRDTVVKGSYHPDNTGASINGVTFPVKLGDGVTVEALKTLGGTVITDASSVTITTTDKRGTTTTEYTGQEALFEAADYSYYALTEAPKYYKEVTLVNGKPSFGEAEYTIQPEALTDVTYTFTADSNYGDYQLNFSNLNFPTGTVVYGATLNTAEKSYGLRHLENMWKSASQLAWSVGNTTTEKHGNTLSYEHYQDMVGKTISSVTYYTSAGVYNIEVGVKVSELQYMYAAVPYSEYYTAERDIQAKGDTTSSDELDAKGEADKGAFDAVSRATTNHGLHRGNFQQSVTIYDTDGNAYPMASWDAEGKKITLLNGSTIGFSRGTITKADGTTATMKGYTVNGIKYVPVAVSTDDVEDFKKEYAVVENGGTLAGGYSEQQLKAYTATANVTKNTNGLKFVTKNADGSFSFGARKTGTESGIADQALKTVDTSNLTMTVKDASGSYGEFLRVDFTGSAYGDLGANMQAVVWKYYGTDSSSDKAITTYGTKFAADNWMHKSMGIQLGLTDSLRCQLPEGYDGTGYWTITFYALGYKDYTTEKFEVTKDKIVGLKSDETKVDTSALDTLITKAEGLSEASYTAASWATLKAELDESKELLKLSTLTQAMVDEQVTHLTDAINGLVKKEAVAQTITTSKDSYTMTYGDKAVALGASAKTALTYASSDKSVATVDANGNVTAVGAGKATITVSAAASSDYKAATKTVTVTVSAASQTISVSKTSYSKKYGNAAFSLGASAKTALSYTSSNKKVATVSSAGKVTIKGIGTTTITIKAAGTNQYNAASKTVKVTVAKGTSTITAKSYTKAYGAKAFKLGAKNSGNGKLTYTSSNKKVATVSSAGKITIKGVGKATITIKAAGTTKYKAASKKVTITVNPAKTSISNLKNVKGKKMTAKWAKKSSATGYQIYYSTSSSFKTYKKTTSTSASKTISGLTKGKTYYVKVRGYKKVSGKTYYASWSTSKKVKITK